MVRALEGAQQIHFSYGAWSPDPSPHKTVAVAVAVAVAVVMGRERAQEQQRESASGGSAFLTIRANTLIECSA